VSNDQLQLVAASSWRGREWVEEYSGPLTQTISRLSKESLALLRQNQMDAGCVLLHAMDALLASGSLSQSTLHLLRRHYYGVFAYYHYKNGAFLDAFACLDHATDALRSAIEGSDYLVLFGESFIDFGYQRARIARSCRQWCQMRRHLSYVGQMLRGEEPLCLFNSGKLLWISDLVDFVALSGVGDAGVDFKHLVDRDARLLRFRNVAAEICCLPGFVIA